MDSSDTQVVRDARRWLREGRRVRLVTVARTWGSSPRPEGSLLAAADDGRVSGSVSGGCIEDDLQLRLWEDGDDAPPRLLCYGTSREEAHRFGLPCGGRLELLLESLRGPDALEELYGHIEAGRIAKRTVNVRDGEVTLDPLETADEPLHFDGRTLSRTFGPRWHLLIVGAGHIGQYLTSFARSLDYRVTLCDPRVRHARQWASRKSTLTHMMPDEAVAGLADRRTAVVTLAHDPRLDDMALMEALLSEAFYVGALGSRKTSTERRERLGLMEVPAPALERLHAPVGLPLGSHSPAEIALAIMAEITAVRNRRQPDVAAHLEKPDVPHRHPRNG